MALEIRPNAIAQDQGDFLYPGIRIGGSFLAHDHVISQSEVVFNKRGISIDFRVASINLTHMLHVDGVEDTVGIGVAASASVVLTVDNALNPEVARFIGPDTGNCVVRLQADSSINSNTPYIIGQKSSGTGATPVAVDSGDLLLQIESRGYDGAGYDVGAKIRFVALETHTATAHGQRIDFFTVDNTTVTQDRRMVIDHDGGIFFDNLLAASASTDVNINGSNELHSVTSSQRFKKYIKPMNIPLDKIYALEPKSFTWRKSVETEVENDFGLIAEEVAKLIPELVNHDERGPYSIRTQPLAVLNLSAILDLNRRLEVLEAA